MYMGFFKKLFNRKKDSESTRQLVLEQLIELENLFSGEILENPDASDIDVTAYANACFSRCEQYQDLIRKKKEIFEQILRDNDGSVSLNHAQFVKDFIDEIVTCARKSADTFHEMLGEGSGKDAETKKRLNREAYDYSLTMRQRFRERIGTLKSEL